MTEDVKEVVTAVAEVDEAKVGRSCCGYGALFIALQVEEHDDQTEVWIHLKVKHNATVHSINIAESDRYVTYFS